MGRLVLFPVRGPSKGYVKNISPTLIDDRQLVLAGGLNMRNRMGGVEMFPGWAKFDDTALTGRPLFLGVFKQSNGTKTLMCLTDDKAYAYNTVTPAFDNITRQTAEVDVDYTAANNQPWSACVFNDLFIFTNHTDDVQKWNGTGRATALGGTPPKAKIVLPFKNHLMLFNVNDGTAYPDKVVWSKLGDPENYADASAGTALLKDTPGHIVAASLLTQDVASIYKDDSWYLVDYAGSPFYFRFRFMGEIQGPISQRAVVNTPKGQVFIGRDNIYLNNGIHPVAIGDAIADEIFPYLNPDAQSLAFAAVDWSTRDVYIFVPTGSDAVPRTMYCWNWVEETWSPPIEFEATCFGEYEERDDTTIDDMTAAIDSYYLPIDNALHASGARTYLFGASDSYIRKLDPALATRDGAGFAAEAEFMRVSCQGDEPFNRHKRVLRIPFEMENMPTAGVSVQVGVADTAEGNLSWSAVDTVTPGDDPWGNFDAMGKYIATRFRTTSSDRLWRVLSYGVSFIPQGER